MPDLLAPNERLSAATAHQQHLHSQLAALLTAPDLTGVHPELSCTRLSDLLATPATSPDLELLQAGLQAVERRYRQLGLTGLLPPDRVWVGTASRNVGAFGGFDYAGQGYRHWQMAAIITRYGSLTLGQPLCTQLAALDLLRAYAHDCLHYGTYRLYQWQPHASGPSIERTRYGINFRRPDGRTYSAADPPGAASTRNLGIVMEGATDTEARAITRHTADLAAIPEPTGPDRFGYRDTPPATPPSAAFAQRPHHPQSRCITTPTPVPGLCAPCEASSGRHGQDDQPFQPIKKGDKQSPQDIVGYHAPTAVTDPMPCPVRCGLAPESPPRSVPG